MRLPPSILALPTSLLLLLVASSPGAAYAAEDGFPPQIERPRGFPAHVKFFPEDPPGRRRDLEAIQEHIIAGHTPVAIKKMSEDEGEKFFPEYWGFAEPDSSTQFSILGKGHYDEAKLLANVSLPVSIRPAFAFHTDKENSLAQLAPLGNGIRALRARNPAVVLAMLERRGFQCPGGTSACISIGYPNLCCGTGDGCFLITDTGLGPVGCCPNGATCAGTVSNCEPGNTPCPSDLGGGCCLPGFTCAGVGCEYDIYPLDSQCKLMFSLTRCPNCPYSCNYNNNDHFRLVDSSGRHHNYNIDHPN
jgi:progranulin